MPAKLDISDLRPHVTLALFRTREGGIIVDEILAQMESLAASLPRPAIIDQVAQTRVHSLGVFTRGKMTAKAVWYCIEHAPVWLGADAGEQLQLDTGPANAAKEAQGVLMDKKHELVVLLADAEFVVVHATQEAMRTRICELIEFGVCGDESRMLRIAHTGVPPDRDELEKAFVRGSAKSAWLEGLHAPTVLKPDRKILSGPDLRYALDAFGEQTFTYTAAISELAAAHAKPFRIGVSYSKGTLWTKATKAFEAFVDEVEEVIKRLKNPPAVDGTHQAAQQPGLPCVAKPLMPAALQDINDGFDVGYEPPAVPEAEMVLGRVGDEVDHRDEWQKHGRFVVADGANTTAEEIVADAFYEQTKIARISLRPVPRGNDHLDIQYRILNYSVAKDHSYLADMDRSLARRNNRFTLRYGSGHVIQSGVLFSLQFKDVIFDRWRWLTFPAGYSVQKEKPEKPGGKNQMVFAPERLGVDGSLFCYIKNFAAELIAPSADIKLSKNWMLLCDDGAGEIADFIAVDPDPESRFVTFIHVKASDGDEQRISVVPFSEVTSQAQKNLRDLDLAFLVADLKNRSSERNRKWAWHADGSATDRAAFIKMLGDLGPGARRYVLLFQPRILKATWDKAVGNHLNKVSNLDVGRMRQLSGLLGTTEVAFQRLEATFAVTGVAAASTSGAATSSRSKSSKPSASKKRRA